MEVNSLSIKVPTELEVKQESKSNGKAFFYEGEHSPDLYLSRKNPSSSNATVSAFFTKLYRDIIHNFPEPHIQTSHEDSTRDTNHTVNFEDELSSVPPPEKPLPNFNVSKNQHKTFTKHNENSRSEEKQGPASPEKNSTKQIDNNDGTENNNLSITKIASSKKNGDQIKEKEQDVTTNIVEGPFDHQNVNNKQIYRNHGNETENPSLQLSVTEHVNSSIGEATQATNMTGQYLVSSKNCKIPDINPMHPSILEFVKFTDPLVCKVSKHFALM